MEIAAKKDTNGTLPGGWRWVRLGEIATIISGQHILESDYNQSGRGIGYLTGPADFGATNPAISKWTEKPRVLCEPMDVLVTVKGAGVGKVNLSPNAPVAIGRQLMAIRGHQGSIDRMFLFNFLITRLNHFQNNAMGATVPGLSRDDLEMLAIPLPPLSEQQRIAEILGEQMATVEKAHAAAQIRLAAVKALPAAVLRQLFGDAPAFAASPVTPTRPVQPGWSWYRLTDLARLATGHTPSRYHPEYWQGAIPWLQLADIRALDGHEARDTSEHANGLGIDNSSAVVLPEGTVCMSRTASVGFFTIMGCPMATSQDFVNWVCGDALDPWFLMYVLIANRKRIRDLGSGAVHQTIYFPTVQAFSVCVPPIGEQRRLVGVLRGQLGPAEKAHAAAEEEVRTINALPAALLCRAFSGGI